MFQKFYTDTIMSKFIKRLLSSTNIPLFDFVHDGDNLLEGCIYIYKHYIIKCLSTGTLNIEGGTALYPSLTLTPNISLVPGAGIIPASIKVLAHYSEDDYNKYNYKFQSNYSYYDPETHKHLGAYLRYLRDYKGLDLMPYYNCYNYYMINDIHLEKPTVDNEHVSYGIGELKGYKLLAIPIKFNTQYTIAIDCTSEVLMRGIIYSPAGMVKIANQSDTYYSDKLASSYKSYQNLYFNNPILYSISTESSQLYKNQKYLYLTIQLPVENNSSVVVLEGDYRKQEIINCKYILNNQEILIDTKYNINKDYRRISLLECNTKESYAFSNRLIEYLLLNVIHENDPLTNNIIKTQQSLIKLDDLANKSSEGSIYKHFYTGYSLIPHRPGIWDENINACMNTLITNLSQIKYLRDMDGNINKDIEELFGEVGVKLG